MLLYIWAAAALLLSALGLVLGLRIALRRWRAFRDQLAQESFERALRSDQRFDALEARLQRLEQQAQADRLSDLLARARASGRLDGERARRIEAQVVDLRDAPPS